LPNTGRQISNKCKNTTGSGENFRTAKISVLNTTKLTGLKQIKETKNITFVIQIVPMRQGDDGLPKIHRKEGHTLRLLTLYVMANYFHFRVLSASHRKLKHITKIIQSRLMSCGCVGSITYRYMRLVISS
jgi:hypothetical protein